MSSIKTLYNRLRTLINENKSGIVALYGNPKVEQTYEYMAYIHSLQYVYVVTDTYSCYFPADKTDMILRELSKFKYRNDYLSLSDIVMTEEDFLKAIISQLLWGMAHENRIMNSIDGPDDKWEIPADVKDWNAYREFTLGLSDTVEGDMEAFRSCLENNGTMVSHYKKFQIGLIYDECTSTFVLSEWIWGVFKDDETGEEHLIEQTRPLLRCDNDWRTLYAKFKSAYYYQLYEIDRSKLH